MSWLSGFMGLCIDHAFEQSDARSPYLGIVTVKQFLRERDERIELAFIIHKQAPRKHSYVRAGDRGHVLHVHDTC